MPGQPSGREGRGVPQQRASTCCASDCYLMRVARSVPSGRVGAAKDAVFRSNEHFREAVSERERTDVTELEHRLDRRAHSSPPLPP